MKCPNCGSNLTIDDEKCQFCGQANPFAVKHRREMKRFTSEFNKTKATVLKESRKVNHWAAKITLIAVLVALNVVIMYFNVESYGVEKFFNRRRIEANYLTYKKQLDQYEEEQNFIAFYKYFEINELYHSDLMNEYRKVQNICSYYSSIYQYVMQLQIDEDPYYNPEDRMEYIAESIGYMYDYYTPDEYSDEEQYKPEHQVCMTAAVEQAEDLIQTYFNLTDEEIESFDTLSNARRQILMEEGMTRNE